MKRLTRIALVCLAAWPLAAGCIARHEISPDRFAEATRLKPAIWEQAEPERMAIGDRELPHTWTLRQEESLIWSTVSIVKAVERLQEEEPATIEMAVSPKHAELLADEIAETRRMILDLRAIADVGGQLNRERWADAVASAFVKAEVITRRSVGPGDGGQPDAATKETMAWSAGPVLEMTLGYLDEQTGGAMLTDLGIKGAGSFRETMAGVILRIGFALAGKQEPEGALAEITWMMRTSERPADLEANIENRLRGMLDEAPAAAVDSRLADVLASVFKWTPTALETLERTIRQWPNMDALTIAFRRRGAESMVIFTVDVAEGRVVRFPRFHMAQPEIVFHGTSRIIVRPTIEPLGEVVVAFDPGETGAGEIRFEGLIYGLARLAGLPLKTGRLREIRVARTSKPRRIGMLNVSLVTDTVEAGGTPRRAMVYQEINERGLERTPFDVRKTTLRTRRAFSYVTPDGRYTFEQVKDRGE